MGNFLIVFPLITGAALLALLVPGWLVAWGLGLQGALRWISSPALSLGVWAGASWVAMGIQLPWHWYTAAALTILMVTPFLVGRLLSWRSQVPWPQSPRSSISPRLAGASVVGGFLCVLPYWVGTAGLSRVAQTWDVVFHLSAIRFTRSYASASPWVSLRELFEQNPTYYPNIFHNLTALLPGSPLQAYLGIMSALLLIWPAMMGGFTLLALARLIGQERAQNCGLIAALGASVGGYFPTSMVANQATPPYFLTLVALPGLVALGMSIWWLRPAKRLSESSQARSLERGQTRSPERGQTRSFALRLRRTWLSSQMTGWIALGFGVGLAGLAATHPTAVFNLLVIFGPGLLWLAWRWLRAWKLGMPVKLALLAGSFALVAGAGWCLIGARLVSMSRFANPHHHLGINLLKLLSDNPSGELWPGYGLTGVVFTLSAVLTALQLLARRRLAWLSGAGAAALLLYCLSAGSLWAGSYLSAPWYMQPPRIAALVWICWWPLGALGIEKLRWRIFVSPRLLENPNRKAWLAAALILVAVVGSQGASLPQRTQLIRSAYDPQVISRGTMLSDAEREFMAREAAKIPDDALIWGAGYQGTPYWWIEHGKRVVFPSLTWPRGDALQVILDLDDGVLQEESCRWLREQGVTHYYADADLSGDGAKYGHFQWVWHRRDVSFVLPRQMLSVQAMNRLSEPGEKFRGQILYRLNLEACGDKADRATS